MGLKSAIAVSEKDAHGGSCIVTYDQIQISIAIHVAHGERIRTAPRRIIHARLKRSVPIAQENTYCPGATVAVIHLGKVEFPVLIEIAHDDRLGVSARRIVCALEAQRTRGRKRDCRR
jgi:hypothetical protein